MARPRIFLSSTCYDLSDIRTGLSKFLEEWGFEVLNSQKGNKFGVTPGLHSHTACIEEVYNSDFLVLIIGGRAGGQYLRSTDTITNEEFRTAQSAGIPVIPFVRKSVNELLPIYRKSPSTDFKPTVDNPKIFHFIEFVSSGSEDNWLHSFETLDDITDTLKNQFCHYLRNYSQSLRKNKVEPATTNDLVTIGFPTALPFIDGVSLDQDELASLRRGVKLVHDMVEKINSASTSKDGKIEKLKTLFVFGLFDESNRAERLIVRQPIFKDHAWSFGKAERVFESMRPLGFRGDVRDFITDYDSEIPAFSLYYEEDETKGWDFNEGLRLVCKTLEKRHNERDALEFFCKGDFRFLADAHPNPKVKSVAKINSKIKK